MHTLILVFLIILFSKTAFEWYLSRLNEKHSEARRGPVPDAFRETMDEDTYVRSMDYTRAKLRFGRVESVFEALVLALALGTGLLVWLFEGLTGWLGTGVWSQALVLFLVGLLLQVPGLPLDYYAQFRLEEKFGFNRSNPRLWLVDQLKSACISAILIVPLVALLLALVGWFPRSWWIIGFGVYFGFMLLIIVLYPKWILPLFNKLEPLPDGQLKERLMELADRAQFRAQTIQVIDGSKRSSHANAYFTGFGRFRRIVLFDTLLDQLEEQELEAVLAHEIGHYRKGHIPKMLAISAVSGLAAFAVIAWLAGQAWFLTGFGFSADAGVAAVFLLFSLVSGVITFWFSPLMSRWSRKHEYEADAFAREMTGGPEPMIRSLRKLSRRNLSNLAPHPLYSAWYYSHPTLLERERALQES